MIQEEIIGGLRNAIERGSSVQQAAKSFVNAGYNPKDVDLAVQQLTSGASTILSNQNSFSQVKSDNFMQPPSNPQPINQQENEKHASRAVVILIIILIILIIALGGIYFFGDSLLSAFLS